MPSPSVSVTIITLNEEENLPRAIESVKWADEILVVDSGSTDKTVQIARNMGARVIERPWPGYGQQKNFAQTQTSNDWVLSLDADEVVPPALATEIQQRLSAISGSVHGFEIPRKTRYLGRWIMHGGWYPNFLVRLANRKYATWTEPHVHEAWVVKGEVQVLKEPLHHFTFRDIRDQVLTNLKYSRHGYEDLRDRGKSACLFTLLWKPVGKFIETYFFKGGVLDGIPGLIISVNAAHSIFLKYAYFFEGGPDADSHRRQ